MELRALAWDIECLGVETQGCRHGHLSHLYGTPTFTCHLEGDEAVKGMEKGEPVSQKTAFRGERESQLLNAEMDED